MLNMHLHDLMHEGNIRLHQMEAVCYWITAYAKPEDVIVMVGDFNAEPDSETYRFIEDQGFVSTYKLANGAEPKITFPTGLQAQFMDTDPPATLDFIWLKGDKVKVAKSERMGGRPDEADNTIYGSDHFPLVTDFIIQGILPTA